MSINPAEVQLTALPVVGITWEMYTGQTSPEDGRDALAVLVGELLARHPEMSTEDTVARLLAALSGLVLMHVDRDVDVGGWLRDCEFIIMEAEAGIGRERP